ncbi:MAG: altronate dehydratase family protein [Firmicutes bacterium]|nr:altronate dehydratase family protein [Bacillota bacterium]
MENAIKINNNDNVAVALRDISEGEVILGTEISENIPAGHKFALDIIKIGENVIKYGYPIGTATYRIGRGDHVHVQNIKTNLSDKIEYSYNPIKSEIPQPQKAPNFMGYRRKDGQVGIRNEVWIINTVGCVNKIAEKIAKKFENVFTFVHPYGCSQLGDDHTHTQFVLKNLVNHPNAAGVLVLGLGCENNNITEFKKILGTWDNNRVKFLNAQDVADDIAAGTALVEELQKYAATFEREPIPINELIIGLKCGGSDGLSGITANPLVGKLSDKIIQNGGSCILTEVPEMFGAETILMNRCTDNATFEKVVNLINDFKDYFTNHGQVVYENPSPGNKDGGITTLEEKSLGCTQKGGESPVVDVLDYGERVKSKGLSLLQGPGNDIVAVTNLAAAGAHIVLFTTGRGTPLGGPVPTIKVSSNTNLAKNKPAWIDFNAGALLDTTNPDKIANDFFDYLLKVANGEQTNNEKNEYREIAIFKDGVTL